MKETKQEIVKINKRMKDLEDKNKEKLVNNYLKSNCNPLDAYRKTFNKQLWRSEDVLNVRATAFFNTIEIQEIYEKKIEDLREEYKPEILQAFNTLAELSKEKTYMKKCYHFDPKTKEIFEYEVEQNTSASIRKDASKLIIEIAGYFETNKKDVQVIQNEFNIVRKLYED